METEVELTNSEPTVLVSSDVNQPTDDMGPQNSNHEEAEAEAEPRLQVSPEEMRSIITVMAATGKFWHDWLFLRGLLSDQLKQVLAEYPETQQSSLSGETYNELVVRLDEGVREIPGSFQTATSNFPSGKALMYFGLLLASGIFFVFVAFVMFLPVMVLMPQKFAISFTLGCAFIIASLFALKGPANQLSHMTSKERLPFTLGFVGCMAGTIYVSMVLHSYLLSVLFSALQVLALGYYTISYFPGGSTGLKFLSSSLTSTVLKLFGR